MRVHLRNAGLLLGQLCLCQLPAQQQLWQVPMPPSPSTTAYYQMMPFVDYNHDGVRDFLQVVDLNTQTVNSRTALQIVSGVDGASLWEISNYLLAAPCACYAGDMNGDGEPDLAILRDWNFGVRKLELFSPQTGTILWTTFGPFSGLYGEALLGDIDVTGDGHPDFVTITSHSSASDVYVYDNSGALLYTVPCLSQGRIAISLAKLGDLNNDGRDDFVVGCNDSTSRGALVVVSGVNGAILRINYGPLPGDKLSRFASNLGDIDGDGASDYAGFPWWTGQRAIVVAYSGLTGSVIRTWDEYANSVVTGEDFDLDGVPDLAIGADWLVSSSPSVFGRTRCYSGRDGTELWRVDNVLAAAGTGNNGSSAWMEYSASLGVRAGSPYPVLGWMDLQWIAIGTYYGRIRTFNSARAGQAPVTGTGCSSTSQTPQIGARETTNGARITIAKAIPGAAAWLNLALGNPTSYAGQQLPIGLDNFGLVGCQLYVGLDASYFRALGTTGLDRGYAAVDLPFHLTTATSGITVVAQWLVFDPATLGYAATQKHQIRGQ